MHKLFIALVSAGLLLNSYIASASAEALKHHRIGEGQLAFKIQAPFASALSAVRTMETIYRELGAVSKCPNLTILSCNYNYYVSTIKVGAISLENGTDNNIVAKIPIKMRGHVRYKEPSFVGVKYEPFKGQVIVTVSASAEIKSNWCLDWSLAPEIEWKERPKISVAVFGERDLSDEFGARILNSISWAVQRDVSHFACTTIRSHAASFWQNYHIPFSLDGQDLHLNIQPLGVRATQVTLTKQSITLSIGLRVATSVTRERLRLKETELPDVRLVDEIREGIKFLVPVDIPYESVREQLKASLSQKAKSSVPHYEGFDLKLDEPKINIKNKNLTAEVEFELLYSEGSRFAAPGSLSFSLSPRLQNDNKVIEFVSENKLVRLLRKKKYEGFKEVADKFVAARLDSLQAVAEFSASSPYSRLLEKLSQSLSNFRPATGARLFLDDIRVSFESAPVFGPDSARAFINVTGMPRIKLNEAISSWVRYAADLTKIQTYKVVHAKTLTVRPVPGYSKSAHMKNLPSIKAGRTDIILHQCKIVPRSDYQWCEVSAGELRGWVHAYHLSPA